MQSSDVVHLTLGSHQLEGKLVPLKKPLAILDFTAETSKLDGMEQCCQASDRSGLYMNLPMFCSGWSHHRVYTCIN
jgi:hypothetical protein